MQSRDEKHHTKTEAALDKSRNLSAKLQYRKTFVERLRLSLPGGLPGHTTGGAEASGLRTRIGSHREPHTQQTMLKPIHSVAAESTESAGQQPASNPAQPRLLIAHTDAAGIPEARQQLETAGFAVEETFGSAQALELFQRLEPDAAVLEASPAGVELCAAIRQLSYGRHTPLVLFTRQPGADLAGAAFDAGATDLIAEPVSWPSLAHRLHHFIETERIRGDSHLLHEPSGLLGRDTFKHLLDRMLGLTQRNSQQLALLSLDTQSVGPTRDSFDRRAQRTLQRSTAQRLQSCLRRGDLIGCGNSPDSEFLIAFGGAAQLESIGQAAQRVLDTLGRAFHLPDRTTFITPYLGIAVYPLDGSSVAQLIERAGVALNRARRNTEGGFCFYNEQLNTIAQRDRALEQQLRNALDHEELYQLYQPIVDGRQLQVIGLESLLRWEHPEHGTLLPARFLRIAERSELASRIGEWVLRNSCRQLRCWLEQGLRAVRMSINVSAAQLRAADFTAQLRAILAETRVDPKQIRLEFDLRAVLSHWPERIERLQELRKLGVQLGVDCNGTCTAAIAELRHLPLDVIKLNLAGLGLDPNASGADSAYARLGGLIADAHQIAFEVGVRGVQNEAQLRFLRQHECDELQGFRIALPLTTTEVSRLLEATKPPSATQVA